MQTTQWQRLYLRDVKAEQLDKYTNIYPYTYYFYIFLCKYILEGKKSERHAG